MKRIGKIKRMATLGLIFLLSINSFAAIVSDNDGSAFVTKAEFEVLKSSFNSQIQTYNDSIEGKIDGAIASYLAGLQTIVANPGENYLAAINEIRPVLFYSQSTNMLHEESIDNLKMYYMWKYFGSVILTHKDTYWIDSSNYTYRRVNTTNANGKYTGSWILDLFNNDHNRYFHFEEKGNETNYIYMINHLKVNGIEYPYLIQDNTISAKCIVGAYFNHWNGDQGTSKIPSAYKFSHRDIDISKYTSNTLEPQSLLVDLGLTNQLDHYGAEFCNWGRTENARDSQFLYNFTNTKYSASKNLLCVTPEDFVTWTKTKTITSSNITAGDWWMNFYPSTYKRTYTWHNWNYCENSGITGQVDTTKSTLKFSLPDFKTYTSDKIINQEASAIVGKAVFPYNGAPVTKVEKNTNKITIDFVCNLYDNSGRQQSGKPYNIIISSEPFSNTDSSDIISNGNTDKIRIFNNTTGTNNYQITLDQPFVEKIPSGSILYARIAPSDTSLYAQINCDSVIYYVEG